MVLISKNLSKSRQHKIARYAKIENETKGQYDQRHENSITTKRKSFLNFMKNKIIDSARILNKMSEVAIKESFYIFL